MPRLFTGLEIPADIGARLSLLRGGLTDARWIEPADYHMTLRFLGDVDRATANEVWEALSSVRRAPLELTIDEIASFGGDKPRSIMARVAPSAALSTLQADHEQLMRRIGLPPEPRKFVAHVTLARLRNVSSLAVAEYLALRALPQPLRFTARRFVLYSARASTGGGPYLVEASYPLDDIQPTAPAQPEIEPWPHR